MIRCKDFTCVFMFLLVATIASPLSPMFEAAKLPFHAACSAAPSYAACSAAPLDDPLRDAIAGSFESRKCSLELLVSLRVMR